MLCVQEEYRKSSTESKWNHQVQLPDGEVIIFHSPNAIAHHTRSVSFDEWGNSPVSVLSFWIPQLFHNSSTLISELSINIDLFIQYNISLKNVTQEIIAGQ